MIVGAQFFRQIYLVSQKHYRYLPKKSFQVSQFYINHLNHLNVWLTSDQRPLVLELRTF